MYLTAGERFPCEEGQLLKVLSGQLEVYAVTKDTAAFRQMFLMEIGAGDAAYPASDEFEQIAVSVYAVTDAEIEVADLHACSAAEHLLWMKAWFHRLAALPWVQRLANLGDDMLQHWDTGTMLHGMDGDTVRLQSVFAEHESILSMLIGVHFGSEDIRFQKQIALRRRTQLRLFDESVGLLMDEDSLRRAGGVSDHPLYEDAAFIVGRIARALAMPERSLRIAPEIAKKLDQIGLIRRLVDKAGMQMRLIHLEQGWHKKDSGVMLGYYGAQKELAALLPTGPTRYMLVTKQYPAGVPLTDEVAAELDTDAFACYAGLPTEKLTPMDLLRFIGQRVWKTDYQTILLASFIAGIVALIAPMVTETIFKDILPIFDFEGLVTVTQIVILSSFTTLAVTLARSVAILRISTNVDMSVEAALLGRLFALPPGFFRRFPSGELVQRLMGVVAVKNILSGEFLGVVFNLVFSFWSLLLMCYYSLKLTVIAVVLWLLYTAAVALLSRNVLAFQRRHVEANNKTAGMVQQIFAGLSKFRLQGAEGQAFHLWSRAFAEEWKWNLRLRWQENYRLILASIEPILIYIVLYYVVAHDMQMAAEQGYDPYKTVITYAQFMAFHTAFAGLNAAVIGAIPIAVQLLSVRPHIENMKVILEECPEASDERVDAELLTGAILVEHVSFSYGADMPDVLHDINLRIEPGETVALVGRSGCGKSTFVRLLLGFEKPKYGAIYYDGQDLSELNLASVRTQMGVVLQNGQLMTGDIFSNIVGTMALTQEDAWAAAEAAGIAEDIRNMPMGMQTVISEGSSNISGGQRQRLLIARALVGKPAILVFDEATSALDNRTQAIVTESLKKMKATRIVIAHRLSTIRDADRILVMERGRIVESGTFDELKEKGGLFAQLVARQVA